MEKVTFTYALSEEQKIKKQQKVERLLKNPILKKWMNKYQVDEEFVYNHSGKLSDYCEMMEKCTSCAGLDFCRQPTLGKQLDLYVDGLLYNRVVNCAYQQKELRALQHQKFYCEGDISKPYFLIDLKTLDVSKESKEYKACYDKVIDLLMDEHPLKGLYLWGKPGSGKTYLAAGICNYYAKQSKRVAFVNVPKLISDLKMMFHESEAMERKLYQIKKADVLVLDDIGGESVTSWSRDDILLPLLDARMEAKKLTIFTSNYAMNEVKQKLSGTTNKNNEPMAAERLIERIKALSCEIFVKGESRRK
ncbi:MAG: ATP-binding protein [Longicatena sp.]